MQNPIRPERADPEDVEPPEPCAGPPTGRAPADQHTEMAVEATDPARPRVVVVGGGFGGLEVARALAKAPVEVVLVDRRNHHLFQPLLYQVATAGLAPASIAAPIRSILSGQENARVMLAEVTAIDTERRRVLLDDDRRHALAYDHLVLAVGGCTTYFGNDAWAGLAPGLKNMDEAIEIRRRVLLAFEQAERQDDPDDQSALLTFVVVGGGATGVEMAGALAELSRHVLAWDFRRIRPDATRVILVEGGERVLQGFDETLSARAQSQLVELGVEVRTGTRVESIDPEGVDTSGGRIPTRTVIWAAGIRANPLAGALGGETDRMGRVVVDDRCRVPGHDRIYAIGDMARFEQDGEPLPGVSPVAMQQGRYVARLIAGGSASAPFRYRDKGSMATIGRSRAIAERGRWKLSGFPAWVAWLVVHLYFLIGFRNRLVVLLNWAWSYITYQRGSRLITGQRMVAGAEADE